MKFGFHAEAELEYVEAIRHYLEIDARIAESFISDVEHGVSAIQRNPLTWRIVEGDFITIGAVMHLSREPEYWKSRQRGQ